MLSDTPKLVFSGYVNNNPLDKAIAEAVHRASAFVKPEKPKPTDAFQSALYQCGESSL